VVGRLPREREGNVMGRWGAAALLCAFGVGAVAAQHRPPDDAEDAGSNERADSVDAGSGAAAGEAADETAGAADETAGAADETAGAADETAGAADETAGAADGAGAADETASAEDGAGASAEDGEVADAVTRERSASAGAAASMEGPSGAPTVSSLDADSSARVSGSRSDAPGPPSTLAQRDEPASSGRAQLSYGLHGYFRTRFNWHGNVPTTDREGVYNGNDNAFFTFQRLRLEPYVAYGDPDKPVAALYMQIDGLDNVVWGDNSRLTRTPLFASDPSATDYEGFDIADTFRLERAWIQLAIPLGQIRVGRMPSQWGMGLLANASNGLGEWGDPLFGTTFDRILFATQPLAIANAFGAHIERPERLIFAIAYDKLVEDPVSPGVDPPDSHGSLPAFGGTSITTTPITENVSARNTAPFQTWVDSSNDVNEMPFALLWRDEQFGPRPTDALTVGGYYVYRWQRRGGVMAEGPRNDEACDGAGPCLLGRPLPRQFQASRIHILDLYWKLRYGIGRARSFYTEGELVHIRGRTNTVSLAGGCDAETGICRQTSANIWGGAFRAGVLKDDHFGAALEWGFSSGDGKLFESRSLRARPLHPDHHVGLLLYQVALATQTAIGLGEAIRPLWSRGGVWNSHYAFPQVRYTVLPGVEVHGAFLVAWARQLLGTVYQNVRDDFTDTACGLFEGDCFIGYEVDLALRVKWGQDDERRWDTELGWFRAGDALRSEFGGFSDRLLWTVQSRLALVF